MPVIHFDRFDLGIDLRKGASVSDANRLLEMKNAHVTTGLATRKRPGITHVGTLEPGTKGLFAAFGVLNTFYGGATVAHANPLFRARGVPFSTDPNRPVWDVPFADVYNGIIYAAVRYETPPQPAIPARAGAILHHYLDGSQFTLVQDFNCPHTAAVVKLAGKIFAPNEGRGDTVRYSKTGSANVWTAPDDAGFLPTGLSARGDQRVQALGVYQNKLVALSSDSAQIWAVDPDPSYMRLENIVDNVGTRYPRTVCNVAGDLYFLSDYGFRSVAAVQSGASLSDVDVGSPVDPLVRAALAARGGAEPMATYFHGLGQYLCAIGDELFVYTLSRSARLAAWSRYSFGRHIDAFAELNQTLYVRCGDDVYRLDEDAATDGGVPFEVVVQLPYMDLKRPGNLKRITAVDVVMEGQCEVSVGFDVRDPDAFTAPAPVRGNTRGGGLIPVECCGTEFSLRFRCMNDQPWRLDSVTLYWDDLGATW